MLSWLDTTAAVPPCTNCRRTSASARWLPATNSAARVRGDWPASTSRTSGSLAPNISTNIVKELPNLARSNSG